MCVACEQKEAHLAGLLQVGELKVQLAAAITNSDSVHAEVLRRELAEAQRAAASTKPNNRRKFTLTVAAGALNDADETIQVFAGTVAELHTGVRHALGLAPGLDIKLAQRPTTAELDSRFTHSPPCQIHSILYCQIRILQGELCSAFSPRALGSLEALSSPARIQVWARQKDQFLGEEEEEQEEREQREEWEGLLRGSENDENDDGDGDDLLEEAQVGTIVALQQRSDQLLQTLSRQDFDDEDLLAGWQPVHRHLLDLLGQCETLSNSHATQLEILAEAEAAALDPTKGSLVSAKVLELQGEAAGVHSTLASAHSVTSGTHVPAMLFTSGIFSAPSLPQDQQQLLHGWDPPTGVEEIDGVHGGGIDASAPSSGRQQSVSDRAQLWDDYGERAYCPLLAPLAVLTGWCVWWWWWWWWWWVDGRQDAQRGCNSHAGDKLASENASVVR